MMQTWAQHHLWTIDRMGGGALANERAANITPENPRIINPWWLYGFAWVVVSPLNGATFTGLRIYGASTVGALIGFPAPGTAGEAITDFGNPGAVGQGKVRQLRSPTVPAAGAGSFVPLSPIPPTLLLEYDMAAGGVGTSHLEVWLSVWGMELSGHE